jgi:hypothetical protein
VKDSEMGATVQPELPRDRHLFGPGPKRILALDGGGVRGALTIAFLERLESLLEERHGRHVRLCDYFDLIGGTSTGAIIACALALGYSAADVRDLYLKLGTRIFRRPLWRIVGLQAKFDSRLLQKEIDAIIGDRTLDSPDLLTGVAIVTKRMDTGSPWILSNNPKSMYWEAPADGSYIANRLFPLGNIIRASTAAPHYFDPEPIAIVDGAPPGLFVDGGVTPHNNPSLHLLLMAALDGYGLRWPLGADKLLLVSMGTGDFRQSLTAQEAGRMPAVGLAVKALTGLMADAETLVITLLHWLGDSPSRWPLNSEIGSLSGESPAGMEALFSFRRYDALLDQGWLDKELGVTLPKEQVAELQRMDEPLNIPRIYELGQKAAARQITAGELPKAFDLQSI